MLATPERIVELTGSLGTISGLQRVNLQIELLTARLNSKDAPLAGEELERVTTALAALSAAIGDMRSVARAMLAEAGVIADHVG
jgi:hypothetical protein